MAAQSNLAGKMDGRDETGQPVQSQQYLTFDLANEQYGVNILTVQEIKGWGGVRQIPDMPDYIVGVIDLRGIIVPIMDLRLRFALQTKAYSETTVVIIVATKHDNNIVPLGLVVDGVSDVLEVSINNIKQAPDVGADKRSRFMQGLVSMPQRMIVILDIEKLLSEQVLKCN